MVNDCRTDLENISKERSSPINLSANTIPVNTHTDHRLISSPIRVKPLPLISKLGPLSNTDRRKTNSVQLYKPIYTARQPITVEGKLSCDQGDEFELVNKLNDDAYHVLHLRTNIECTISAAQLSLDMETPLRLGSNDRGVIQRCLLQYNTPGAYLIRRSRSELNAFVLSISQASNYRNAEDWHYLICIHPTNNCFYLAQESKLNQLFFSSFQQLVHDDTVRDIIPLSSIVPCQIEFEEDLWHIPRRHLTLQCHLGNGEFGEVWRALWKNGDRTIPVAVKKLHRIRQEKSTPSDSIREIEVMKTLRNNYIVTLHGVAQDLQTRETLLVTELMENGDLKNWLRNRSEVPDEKLVVSFAFDICRGMTFLEQQLLLHRDLACRNVLLDNGARTAKIADFGLSTRVNKDEFAQRNENCYQRLPVRWTAPEVLRNQKAYSIKSDVWSFGIVLVEIWLKGDDPYPEEKDFATIRALVQGGHTHRKPSKCSKHFYNQLILPCLYFQPQQRPNFRSLVEFLRQWKKEKGDYEHVDSSYVEYSS